MPRTNKTTTADSDAVAGLDERHSDHTFVHVSTDAGAGAASTWVLGSIEESLFLFVSVNDPKQRFIVVRPPLLLLLPLPRRCFQSVVTAPRQSSYLIVVVGSSSLPRDEANTSTILYIHHSLRGGSGTNMLGNQGEKRACS